MGLDDRQNIVVVGGGAAGGGVVRGLVGKVDHSKYRVVLINPRPFYTYIIAGARMVVSPYGNLETNAFIPYDRALPADKGELIVGTVTSIRRAAETGGHVVLSDGREIAFAFLVLAPGSIWSGPLAIPDTKDDIDAWITTWRAKIENAKDIVIVGGGAVGVEIAGEIRHFFPDKSVTMVQKDAHLLNATYPDKWRLRVDKMLRDGGVKLVTDDVIDASELSSDTGTVTTRKGAVIHADLIIPCVGTRPNTDFVCTLGEGVLDSRGFIPTKPTLQLPHFPEIFAAGDVLAWDEQKQMAKANGQAGIVASNIVSMTKGASPGAVYKGSWELIVITFGPNGGTGYFGILWGIIVGDWFSRFVKSKDLVIGSVRKTWGY
ncbi:FAD/NAD(P)-binding domain-containing protein [Exidia glandulosa HHB12029]|uniref:FAD/NAD(P)-binding domain-containing protein n=1 Tax=Exidia glandulosa HHB12029 TaxID=1314781 RepID=A0A165KSR7_EXIGL|nr:FAD/NAD(P)-binding domain-containing protein [Exidia glandulosa HHB12029]